MSPVLVLAGRHQDIKNLKGYAPSCPHRMYVHPLSDIHDQLHIGIVVVICAPGNL